MFLQSFIAIHFTFNWKVFEQWVHGYPKILLIKWADQNEDSNLESPNKNSFYINYKFKMNCYLIEFNERPCLTFAVICMPQASPSLNLTRPLNSDMNLMYFNLQLLHHIIFHQRFWIYALLLPGRSFRKFLSLIPVVICKKFSFKSAS